MNTIKIKWWLMIVVVAVLCSTPIHAISTAEADALDDMFRSWSVLGSIGWTLVDRGTMECPTVQPWVVENDSRPRLQCDVSGVLVIALPELDLAGTIPDSIGNLPRLLELRLVQTNLSGTIPSTIGNAKNLQYLYLSANGLEGTIPSTVGELTLISNLQLDENKLTGTIPRQLNNLVDMSDLRLHTNKLYGPIPDLSRLSFMTTLSLSVNGLSGVPGFDLSYIPSVALSCNRLDLCSNYVISHGTAVTSCELGNQEGFPMSAVCAAHYKNGWNCGVDDPMPGACPNFPLPPEPVSKGCSSPIPQPADAFDCIQGVWTSTRGITVGTIQVSGSVLIQGNLTVNSSISFSGLDGTVEVAGCANLDGSTIEITLTPEDLEKLNQEGTRSRQLINQRNCSRPISSIPLSLNSPKSCKKVSATSNDQSTGPNTLTALLKVNATGCKLWWIILVSVLGAILILAVILAIIFTQCASCERKVMPYSSTPVNK